MLSVDEFVGGLSLATGLGTEATVAAIRMMTDAEIQFVHGEVQFLLVSRDELAQRRARTRLARLVSRRSSLITYSKPPERRCRHETVQPNPMFL